MRSCCERLAFDLLVWPMLALAVVFAGTGTRAAACEVPPAARALLDTYPGLRIYMGTPLQSWIVCVRAFWGRVSVTGATPEAAADAWLYAPWMAPGNNVFGVDGLYLDPVGTNVVGQGLFTVFRYRQYIGGKPVWPEGNGMLRLLVENGTTNGVVYVGGWLTHPHKEGFRPDTIDGPTALALVQAMPEYAQLQEWSEPQIVAYVDAGPDSPIRAWTFLGWSSNPGAEGPYRFYVNAADSVLVTAQIEVEYADITGHVSARATAGMYPDTEESPPTLIDLEGAHVYIGTNGETADYCDSNGFYVLSDVGSEAVTVTADLAGEYVRVLPEHCDPLVPSKASVIAPASVDFVFNTNGGGTECTVYGTDGNTAQVNAFRHVTAAHNWYKSLQPWFASLDFPIYCWVNVTSSPFLLCNAAYYPSDVLLKFGDKGSDCVNMAYSSIIAHEYGHFVHHRLFLYFGGSVSFGEGFADSFAILRFDDPVVGRDFHGPGTGRNIEAANKHFPCISAFPYTCAPLLAGVWWDIKLAMQQEYGTTNGLALTQQLFTDWSQIASGPNTDRPSSIGGNVSTGSPAYPLTAVEVLQVDDNNGDICATGTPHDDEICQAFAAHCIACPRCLVGGDCNSNGIFDACEPDCNTNGLPDGCDIAGGTSEDCNTNGIPDECDLQDRLYGISGSGKETVLHTLDEAGAEVTWSAPAALVWPHAFGLTCHPVTRELYALVGVGKDGDCALAKADAASGGLTKLGTNAPFPCLNDLAFAGDGTLYGLAGDWDSSTGEIVTVDLQTLELAPTGIQLDGGAGGGIAFHPQTGQLYHVVGDELHIVDVEQSTVTSNGLNTNGVWTALAFHPSGEPLLVSDGKSRLYTIDPLTYQVVLVGRLDRGPMLGLAFIPARADCNSNGTPDECHDVALSSAKPADQESLWRTQHNIARLTFDGCITTPQEGEVLIQELGSNGAFGPDLSGGFAFSVENDTTGRPRILHLWEDTPTLTDHTWIALRNTNGWSTAEDFEVQYMVQVGDVNNDGLVLASDLSAIFPKIPTANADDDERADVNGDGKVLASDLSAVFPHIPSAPVPKPSGHDRGGDGGGEGAGQSLSLPGGDESGDAPAGGDSTDGSGSQSLADTAGEGGDSPAPDGDPSAPGPCDFAQAAVSIEVRPLGGGAPVTVLAPHTTYELHYGVNCGYVSAYVLGVIAESPEQGLAEVAPPATGDGSSTGHFAWLAVGDASGECAPAPDYPAGRFWTGWATDWTGSGTGTGAALQRHLCDITTGEAGEVRVELCVDWYAGEAVAATTLPSRIALVVEQPEEP